jgi:hypothetical protein
MTRNTLVASAFGAAIALGSVASGCSSTSNSNGGSGGVTGAGGKVGTGGNAGGGVGGITANGGTMGSLGGSGQGGRADAGSDGPAALPMCSPAPDDGTACTGNPTCTKNCGINISSLSLNRAQKACTCSGANGTWSCPSTNGACVYPTDFDPTCLRLPATVPACPRDLPDGGADAGSGLIRPNLSICEVPGSEVCGNVCGSANVNTPSYQDGQGGAKVGYCVCILGKYQCASVAEWYYPTGT